MASPPLLGWIEQVANNPVQSAFFLGFFTGALSRLGWDAAGQLLLFLAS